MGKKAWLDYSKKQNTMKFCGVVKELICKLNRGLGCTCGKWSTPKIFTEDELESARNFDIQKALEEAILARESVDDISKK